jgi:hypothetical protein
MKTKTFCTIILSTILMISSIACFNQSNKKTDETHIDVSYIPESEEVIPNQYFNIKQTLAFRSKEAIHADFRKNFKYHFQTVGLAEYPADSSYLFVISEPSPQVSEEDIKNVFSNFNCDFQIKQHKIGYDGFARSMLVVVGKATKENMTQLKNNLHSKLYFNSYKSERSTIELPVKEGRQYFSKSSLNYEISLAELNKWFIEDKELFRDRNENTFSMTEILNNNKYGVFFSQNAGFVVWVIDKQKDLNRQKQHIRQFTLDSDLILGAFSNYGKLVVIGRERMSSMSELPPLNVETILLLASVKESELSQSLDIMDLLAGKMNNDKDYCPSYLSKELENTEFGHLLTITDILLKDWSEHGNLKYEEYNYPKPKSYPFDKSLFKKLGINELVYNWNTKNAITSIEMNNYNIYSLNRTGSLPVSYFNSQENEVPVGGNYEQQAYQYFSTINNTDLARVVQYQTLYALFKNNDIEYNGAFLNNNPPINKPYLLKDKVQLLFTNIRNLSNIEKTTIAQNIAKDLYKRYQKRGENWENETNAEIEKFKRDNQINIENEIKRATKETEQHIESEIKRLMREENMSRTKVENDLEVKKWIKEVWADHNKNISDYKGQNEIDVNNQISEYREQTRKDVEKNIAEKLSDLDKVQSLLKDLDDNSFSRICRYLSYPRGDKYAELTTVETAKKITKHLRGVVGNIYKGYYYYFGVDMSDVMTFYSNSLKDNSSLWIKTPSLVITYNNPGVVGGHNLSSAIRFVSSLSAVNSINMISKKGNVNMNISAAIPRNRTEVIPVLQRNQRGL